MAFEFLSFVWCVDEYSFHFLSFQFNAEPKALLALGYIPDSCWWFDLLWFQKITFFREEEEVE